MKSLSPNKVSLSTGTKLFINESLSLYYQVIWSKCKNLLRSKYTFSFYTANVTIQIKNHENSSSNVITPGDELILFTLKSLEDLNGTSGLLDTNLFFIRIHSMQGWIATTRHGITRKRSTTRLKHMWNLFRKNLQLIDVC